MTKPTPALNVFENSLLQLDQLEQNIQLIHRDILNISYLEVNRSPSALDGYDYAFALVFGVLGGIASSNKRIEVMLDKVHTDSSKSNPKAFLGKLLQHNGDEIDQATMSGGLKGFINRDYESRPEVGFHRLMRGHDPFSMSGDNPFQLLCNQHGLLKGILQVFRHLTADTFSKQGLPIPFHSFFDYEKDGKLSNWLLKITKESVKAADVNQVTAFNHMFTVRMQDIGVQGLVYALCRAYFFAHDIKDDIRKSQVKIIAYTSCFFTHGITGMVRQGGVPYINWPTLSMLMKEMFVLFKLNYQEIKSLERVTASLVTENRLLERKVYETGNSLVSHVDGSGYIRELQKQDRIFEDLVDFFEED
ncbi:hypothetical protein [Paenibacillus borealis]|uniref:Uncharacterized protein n=1 Tax=Paenibacillus borealis TaxID=160799 RepID=A0A089LAJ7_PAEBO|nr:hypothetical protein [Paenibacillus borealis]AIQ56178.1 hypothetical protein PBOR_03810 [Paenibacillus borealis]